VSAGITHALVASSRDGLLCGVRDFRPAYCEENRLLASLGKRAEQAKTVVFLALARRVDVVVDQVLLEHGFYVSPIHTCRFLWRGSPGITSGDARILRKLRSVAQ
jgi:hypothetical protein